MSKETLAPLSELPPCQVHLRVQSPESMSRFATSLAPHLGAGDVLALSGDLGTGKTHFSRSLIAARLAELGQVEDIPSPSFTLVQVYPLAECDIWHVDLYRLCDPRDVDELGLIDAFETDICLVEWPERMQADLPDRTIWLSFHHDPENPQARDLTICCRNDHPKKALLMSAAKGSLA